MPKICHLLLSHKRMNRYLLDVGLCKHKKNRGRRSFSFSCLRSAKFKYTRIEQSSQMGEIDERMRPWASNWIYLSLVSSNIKEKNSDISSIRHERYCRPTIHPTVSICILKNLPESTPRGRFVLSSVLPMV